MPSKVGAMPHPSGRKESHGRKGRRNQGITMEDLKKQTAKRLAQEQNRQNRQSTNPSQGSKKKGAHQLKATKGESIRGKQPNGLDLNNSNPSMMVKAAYSQGSKGTLRRHNPQKSHAPQDNIHHVGSFREHPKIKVHENYYRETQPVRTLKDNRQFLAQTNKANVAHTNTLPHGLTVTELKEMTRARLASESAKERNGSHPSYQSGGNQRYSVLHRPDDYGSRLKPNRQRFRSHDGFSSRNRVNSSESLSSAPPDVFQHVDPRQMKAYSPRNIIRHSFSNEGYDNASVTSFNSIGSEYIGSDLSGVHTIQTPLNEDASRYSLNQSMSFSSENRAQEVSREDPSRVVTGLFDSSNRRRASTGSPPTLSNLLEDKPLTNAFFNEHNSGAQNLGLFHYVGKKSAPSSRGASPTSLLQSNQSDIWGDIFSRSESLTMASTLTQSFDSSGTNDNGGFIPTHNSRSFLRQNSLGGTVPNSVAESVLDPSPPKNERSTQNNLAKNSQLFSEPLRNTASWNKTNLTDNVGGDQLVMSRLGNDLNSYLKLQSGKDTDLTSFRSLSSDLPLANGALERQDGPSLLPRSFEAHANVQNDLRTQGIYAEMNSSHNMPPQREDFVQKNGVLK